METSQINENGTEEMKTELVNELRKQFEEVFLLVECSEPLIKELLSNIKNYFPIIEDLLIHIQKLNANINAVYLKELEKNGFSRKEAMNILLKQSDQIKDILQNINIKYK